MFSGKADFKYENIHLFLRNEEMESVEVEVEDDALVEVPTPYMYDKVLYYGSSIVSGKH